MIKNFLIAFQLQYVAAGVRGIARLVLAVLMKVFQRVYTRIGSGKKFCPCCGWHGTHFLPYIDAGYVNFQEECPICRSHARHRAHSLFYRKHFSGICGRLLYIAPEKNLEYFRDLPALTVATSEYSPSALADFHYNLLDIDCPDSTWDFIVCHRVIEHVSDDRQAMSELYRVLKPGGICVISVPVDFNCSSTIEYQHPNPFESCHYYRYGTDFVTRIPSEFAVAGVFQGADGPPMLGGEQVFT